MTTDRNKGSANFTAKFYTGMIAVSTYEKCARLCPGKPHPPNYEMEMELFKFQEKIEARFKDAATKIYKFPKMAQQTNQMKKET